MRVNPNRSKRSILSLILVIVLLFVGGCASKQEKEKQINIEAGTLASMLSFWDALKIGLEK